MSIMAYGAPGPQFWSLPDRDPMAAPALAPGRRVTGVEAISPVRTYGAMVVKTHTGANVEM